MKWICGYIIEWSNTEEMIAGVIGSLPNIESDEKTCMHSQYCCKLFQIKFNESNGPLSDHVTCWPFLIDGNAD